MATSKMIRKTWEANLGDFFSRTNRAPYSIPTYQRPYTWSTDLVEDFLDDIKLQMELGAAGTATWCFMGFIVVQDQSRSFDVLDGQQRLLTTQLLVAYLEAKQRLADSTRQSERSPFFDETPTSRRLVVTPRELDTPVMMELCENPLSPPSRMGADWTDAGERMRLALDAIARKMAFWEQEDPEAVRKFAEFFYGHCGVSVIEAESLDAAYALFTALNSKGQPLSKLDVLKAALLAQLRREGVPGPESGKMASRWEQFESAIGQKDCSRLSGYFRAPVSEDLRDLYSTTDLTTALNEGARKTFAKCGSDVWAKYAPAGTLSAEGPATWQTASALLGGYVFPAMERLQVLDSLAKSDFSDEVYKGLGLDENAKANRLLCSELYWLAKTPRWREWQMPLLYALYKQYPASLMAGIVKALGLDVLRMMCGGADEAGRRRHFASLCAVIASCKEPTNVLQVMHEHKYQARALSAGVPQIPRDPARAKYVHARIQWAHAHPQGADREILAHWGGAKYVELTELVPGGLTPDLMRHVLHKSKLLHKSKRALKGGELRAWVTSNADEFASLYGAEDGTEALNDTEWLTRWAESQRKVLLKRMEDLLNYTPPEVVLEATPGAPDEATETLPIALPSRLVPKVSPPNDVRVVEPQTEYLFRNPGRGVMARLRLSERALRLVKGSTVQAYWSDDEDTADFPLWKQHVEGVVKACTDQAARLRDDLVVSRADVRGDDREALRIAAVLVQGTEMRSGAGWAIVESSAPLVRSVQGESWVELMLLLIQAVNDMGVPLKTIQELWNKGGVRGDRQSKSLNIVTNREDAELLTLNLRQKADKLLRKIQNTEGDYWLSVHGSGTGIGARVTRFVENLENCQDLTVGVRRFADGEPSCACVKKERQEGERGRQTILTMELRITRKE